MPHTVLLVDDQPEENRLRRVLGEDFSVIVCRSARELDRYLERSEPSYDVALVDYRLDSNFGPKYENGIRVTAALVERHPEVQVVGLSRYLEPTIANEAGGVIADWLLAGARWFTDKARLFDGDPRSVQIIRRWAEHGLRLRARSRTAEAPRLESYSGLADTLSTLKRIAAYPVSVLLIGETGTGKELLANRIHELSRRKGRFVVGNCANLRGELAEVMIHGQEYHQNDPRARGYPKPGWFELAAGGTVFLDEVGDLPAESQASLLRVLQERKVRRVLGSDLIQVDFRLIAATNRPLTELAAAQQFRPDLFYRLAVFEIRVPGLAERRDDIPELMKFFQNKYGELFGRSVRFSPEVIKYFQQRDYPGNVRELENVIQRVLVLASSAEPSLAEVENIDHLVLSPSVPRGRAVLSSREDYATALVAWLRANVQRLGDPMGFRSKTALLRAAIEEVNKTRVVDSSLPRTPQHVLNELVRSVDEPLYNQIERGGRDRRNSASRDTENR